MTMQMDPDGDVDLDELEDWEAAETIGQIDALSEIEFPDRMARDELVALIRTGALKVSLYRELITDRPVLWIVPPYSWLEGRFFPEEWAARYHAAQARGLTPPHDAELWYATWQGHGRALV
jgi:hypothetical protein